MQRLDHADVAHAELRPVFAVVVEAVGPEVLGARVQGGVGVVAEAGEHVVGGESGPSTVLGEFRPGPAGANAEGVGDLVEGHAGADGAAEHDVAVGRGVRGGDGGVERDPQAVVEGGVAVVELDRLVHGTHDRVASVGGPGLAAVG